MCVCMCVCGKGAAKGGAQCSASHFTPQNGSHYSLPFFVDLSAPTASAILCVYVCG